MSDVKLKACPFCGDDTPEIQQEGAEWFVACSHVDECGAEGHRALVDDYAIECWNRRSHDARLIEALGKAQKALAMLTEPNAIRSTRVHQAWGQAVEAELAVRQALAQAREDGE